MFTPNQFSSKINGTAMKWCLLFFIFILFISYGCKKETQLTPEKQPFRVGIPQPDFMTIIPLKKIIGDTWGTNSEYLYNLDFDKNGWDDFAFYAWADYTPGGVETNESKIIILNNKISLIGREYFDTIKLCTYMINDSLTQIIKYNVLSGYKCENDTQVIKYTHKICSPFFFNQGDSINDNEFSESSEFILSTRTETLNYLIWEGGILIGYFKESQFWGLNDHEQKYVVFKMKEGDRERLGWIKLETEHSSKITLRELVVEN